MSRGLTLAYFTAMRKSKPCRKKCGKIGIWFDACISNLSFLVLIALMSALTFKGLSLFRKPSPPPVDILITGQTNSLSGNTLTQVVITNSSRRWFSYNFTAEVRKRSWWQDGSVQHRDAASANLLPPKSGRFLSIPITQEGDEWRLTLVAHRVLGGFEYPFAKDIQVVGPEILNPSGKKLNPPQIAARRISNAVSAVSNPN